jgi:3-dehydroquinate dehydratase-2
MANKGIKVLIINGPNLNLLGTREPKLYGNRAFGKFLSTLQEEYEDIELEYFQSNHEGELIDRIHQARSGYDGVVFNPGAFAHTSIALRDAIMAVDVPIIEVHITNVFARESFRSKLILADACMGVITGLGLEGYRLAVERFRLEH